jgi:hypothetical protein
MAKSRIAAAFLMLSVFGCNPGSITLPSDPADLEGLVVTKVTESLPLVRATFKFEPAYADSFVVRANGPVFLRESDGSLRTIDFTALREGDRVRLWIEGAELRSRPPSYAARVAEVWRE